MRRAWAVVALLGGFGCLGACGDSEDAHEVIESWACDLFADGEATAVTAGTQGEAPPALLLDRLYDVTLPALAEDNGGDVTFELGAARYLLYVSEDVPAALFDAADDEQPIDLAENPFEHCSQVAAEYRYVLEAGEFTLRLGPTPAASVHLILTEDAADY
jgi:hypothetical protein